MARHKPYFGILIWVILLSACQPEKKELKQAQLELNTIRQQYAAQMDFVPDSSFATLIQQNESIITALRSLEKRKFPPVNQEKVQKKLKEMLAFQKELAAYQSDASLYNLGGRLKKVLADPTLSHKERSSIINELILSGPIYYATAKNKLNTTNPDQLKLSIRKQVVGLALLEGELRDSFPELEKEPEWRKNVYNTRIAMKDYLAWCNSQLFEYIESTN